MQVMRIRTQIKVVLVFVAAVWMACGQAMAQTKRESYDREFTAGFFMGTSASIIGGLNFKYAVQRNQKSYNIFMLELANVKHPKELRLQNDSTNNIFIFGKQNYLFVIRPMIGRELLLFSRLGDEGIQCNALFAVGPAIGLVKPYYVLYGPTQSTATVVPYDINTTNNPQYTWGNAGMLRGLGNSKIVPGITLRSSLNFSVSRGGHTVLGMELGFLAEIFTETIVIMPNTQNRSAFTSVFANFYLGYRK